MPTLENVHHEETKILPYPKKKKKAFEVHTHIYNKLEFANIMSEECGCKRKEGLEHQHLSPKLTLLTQKTSACTYCSKKKSHPSHIQICCKNKNVYSNSLLFAPKIVSPKRIHNKTTEHWNQAAQHYNSLSFTIGLK